MGEVSLSYNSDGTISLSTGDNSNSNIDGYYIDVYPSVNERDHFYIEDKTLSFTLDGLISGVTYEISVSSVHFDIDMNEYTGKAQDFMVTIGGGIQGDLNGIWYMDSNGDYFSGWKNIDGEWYYFDPYMLTGFITIDGKTYHLNRHTGAMDTGWIYYDYITLKNWYYLGNDGVMRTGWQKLEDKWYYFDVDGVMAMGSTEISGKWYYFDENGVMQTGWQYYDDSWHYYKPSGAGYQGWLYEGGKWYCFYNGAVDTGSWNIDGTHYYFDENGVMQTGWQYIDGYWYYYSSSGAGFYGWINYGGKWYFILSGIMLTGWYEDEDSGKWYYFDASGAMVNGWKKISGKWYYFEKSGAMKTGWLKYNGSWYYLDRNGAMVSSTTVRISGKNYKFNSSGICINP